MKKFKLLSFYFFLVLLICSQSLLAQESEEEAQEIQIETSIEVITLNEISSETEKLGLRIRRLREILRPIAKAAEIDSLLNTVYNGIKHERDTLLQDINTLKQRALQDKNVVWENYKSELKDYQSTIDSRIKVLNSLNNEVVGEINRWTATKKNLTENSESTNLFSNMDTMIFKLQDIVQITLIRLDSIFIIQKRLTEVVLISDEVIAEISRAQLQLQKNYFAFDSPPIWNINKIDSLASDSTRLEAGTKNQNIISGVRDDINRLKEFAGNNIQTFIFQILFVLILLTLMLVVKRRGSKEDNELTNPLEKEARVVIDNPVSASLAVGLLVSASFYKALIPVFSDLLIFIILAATVYILPKLTHKKVFIPLLIIFLVNFFISFEVYMDLQSLPARIILLLTTAALSYAIIAGRKVIKEWPGQFRRISAFNRFILPVFLLFTFIGILANIIGMVYMARFLTLAVLTSVGLGSVVYLSVKVFTSIIILAFKLRSHFNLPTLTNLAEVVQKRVRPVLMLVGIFVWIFFTLMGFELYEYINLWVIDILEIKWKIGEMTISVGGILAFMFIFFITMFLAKIIATIFQDEWLIKVLPRGIAPAISLIARIILIATGFYMGLSAAGFDLSKIGLLLGALGVGIGFGLQSVVLNFISGLILAFERPINLGDAIEVDQEFGVVTSIGVRASNIKTYKGSEVIIPNGDLVSKKVVNWTLSNRDRRSRILMKTSAEADPEKVIKLFNSIAAEQPGVYKEPTPSTLFYGYNEEGNLDFALIYWTSFSDTLNTDSDIALKIYKSLKEEGIQAPIPVRRIVSND